MELEILKELEYNRGYFPKKAVEDAVKLKEDIIPHLLKRLEYATANAEKIKEEGSYFLHIYAMFLLAQFRETKAYPLIIKFFSLTGELAMDMTGDLVTENLPSILASVCGKDIKPVQELIENSDINEWVRGAAVKSIKILTLDGRISRSEAMDYFKSLFSDKLEKEHSNVWDELGSACADLHPKEVYEDIVKAYKMGLINPGFISLKSVDECLSMRQENCIEKWRDSHDRLIDDVIEEMSWWYCFNRKKEIEKKPLSDKDDGDAKNDIISPVRQEPKTGRNDPCPCGSGKKYKKCCLNAS